MTARRLRDGFAVVVAIAIAVVVWAFVGAATLAAQESKNAGPPAESLSRAKELYLSAAYDEALELLDGLPGETTPAMAMEIAQYRVFCLMALGRADEARKVIEAMVSNDPFYRMPDGQTPPRIRTAFQDTRRAMLPKLAQRRYADAKAAFDKKDPRAAEQFDKVLALLDDPELKGTPSFADLRTVATGFRDLSKAAAAPPPAPPPPAAAPAVETAALPERPAGVAQAPVVIIPPVAISQTLPPWTASVLDQSRTYSGTIAVLVNAQGNVASARIQRSVHPRYDADLLRAAQTWKYRPATRNGVPTEYEKIVEIQLKPK